jgi:hypothetical protein
VHLLEEFEKKKKKTDLDMPPLLPKSVTPSMLDLTLKRGPTNLINSNFSRTKFQYLKTRSWQGLAIFVNFIIHPKLDV